MHNLQEQVHDILEKANSNYKKQHDQHWVPHKFQVGEKVWLHLQKDHLTGPYMNLRPLQYVNYTITKVVGDSSFELSKSHFLYLHPIFNVELI
jgi:hypothetical protein